MMKRLQVLALLCALLLTTLPPQALANPEPQAAGQPVPPNDRIHDDEIRSLVKWILGGAV